MKKVNLVCVLVLLTLFTIGVATTSATSVTFTYTADNTIMGWWFQEDGSAPVSLPLGLNANDWRFADTYSPDLAPAPGHSYQIIWQVVNSDKINPPENNPGGFLAEIAPNPLFTNLLSSSLWEVAQIEDSLIPPSNFNSLSWTSATQWGANNDPSTIWYQAKGGPVSGISGTSQWIWTSANFADSGAPDFNDSVFIRTTGGNPVPEPSTLLLIGSGLIGLAVLRRKVKK